MTTDTDIPTVPSARDWLYNKLRVFYWAPAAIMRDQFRGDPQWSGPDARPVASRNLTLLEMERFARRFGDPTQHDARQTDHAYAYLARHRDGFGRKKRRELDAQIGEPDVLLLEERAE